MSFLLSVTGQIEWTDAMTPAGSSWHCKYELIAGADWKIVGGLEGGISQQANVVTNGDKVVFNLPIEITYKSTNPYGWPQIVVSVYKNMTLEGYGRTHLPLKPGVCQVDVNLSKPIPSSFLGYIATFFGYQPELIQPKMLATSEGNNLLRMESTGSTRISFNIVMQGFKSLGYDV